MKLIGTPTEPVTPSEENNGLNLFVNTEIYAKKLPNFSSNDIWKLEKNKQVKKINEINNWVEVTDNQNTGWILKNKLQDTKPQEVPDTSDNTNTTSNENTSNKTSNTTNTTSNTTNVTNTTTSNTNTTSANNTVNNTVSSSTSSSVNKKATITVETAKVREKATTDSNVLGFLDYGDEITLLEKEGDWYKINFENKTGYVKNTLLKVEETTVSSRSLTEERKDNTAKNSNSEVVEYAKQYLGYPYIVGGKTPATGFDCSGFTRYIFLKFGYSLGATTSSQQNAGEKVSRDNLMPGDLIIFLNEEKTGVGHTGIYIGNAEFIHSANPERGVVIDNINTNSYYNERFVSARRIVQ